MFPGPVAALRIMSRLEQGFHQSQVYQEQDAIRQQITLP